MKKVDWGDLLRPEPRQVYLYLVLVAVLVLLFSFIFGCFGCPFNKVFPNWVRLTAYLVVFVLPYIAAGYFVELHWGD